MEEMLDDLKRIRQLEFSVTALTVTEPWATPLNGFVKSYTRRITLANRPIAQVRAAIVKAITGGQLENGRIRGDDADGAERIVQLTENADVFGAYDFDDVAGGMSFDLSNLGTAPFLQEMLNKARQNRPYFETREA